MDAPAVGERVGERGAEAVRLRLEVRGERVRYGRLRIDYEFSRPSNSRANSPADLASLAELAPYVLPPSLDFARWLRGALTYSFRQPIPDYDRELLDHFEVDGGEPIVLRRGDAEDGGGAEDRCPG